MDGTRKVNAVNFRHLYYDEEKSQVDMAEEYMKRYGTITSDEALEAFGCRRLAAVIFNLKKRTDVFVGRMKYERVAIYALDEDSLEKAVKRV